MKLNLEEYQDHPDVREWASQASARIANELTDMAKTSEDLGMGLAMVSSSCLVTVLALIRSPSDRERFMRHHVRQTIQIYNAAQRAKRENP